MKVAVERNRVARGKVERIGVKGIRGWVFLESGDEPELQVFVNGRQLKIAKPSIERPELQKKLGTSTACGFSIEFTDDDQVGRQRINEVQIKEVNSGYDFGKDVHLFCPLVKQQADSLRELFVPEYYRKRYGLESSSNSEAFQHFVQEGIYQDHDANPWFSSKFFRNRYQRKLKNIEIPILAYLAFEDKLEYMASESFDPKYYAQMNPDLSVEWGLLKHYVQHGHQEGRAGKRYELPDSLKAETDALAQIEPKLGGYFDRQKSVVEYPLIKSSTYAPCLIRGRYTDGIQVAICVPFLSRGGADLVSTYILKAFQQRYGAENVLLLVTDRAENVVPQWIMEDTQVVYLDEESNFSGFDDRVHTLHSIIGMLSPEKIVNINSHAAWEMYKVYGRQLASVADLYAYIFCFDYTVGNARVGYIVDYVPKTIKYLKRIFCDNQTVIDDMESLYGFSKVNKDVLQVVYVPTPRNLSILKKDKAGPFSKKILWGSRLVRQKRPELLVKIAQKMSECEFVVYGTPSDCEVSDRIVANEYPNIEYRGVFGDMSDLNLEEFSLFLNTSAWDGLPTMLINMMGAGLPIVSSSVGGIKELVSPDTGYLVEQHNDVSEYCVRIMQALVHYSESESKAANGVEFVRKRHKWNAFYARLEEVGAFDNHSNAIRRVVPLSDRREYSS
ncbi:glycosyltransferase family 4 protein [Granulosicoccus sp. 3-233]|uniref:glycosyltransferase family 4 protein n=1 Tax=Granulosicoccus sp. 3-233 TaxID=3417969 RepID=UPI003D3274D4